jgi:hypothetical protein
MTSPIPNGGLRSGAGPGDVITWSSMSAGGTEPIITQGIIVRAATDIEAAEIPAYFGSAGPAPYWWVAGLPLNLPKGTVPIPPSGSVMPVSEALVIGWIGGLAAVDLLSSYLSEWTGEVSG